VNLFSTLLKLLDGRRPLMLAFCQNVHGPVMSTHQVRRDNSGSCQLCCPLQETAPPKKKATAGCDQVDLARGVLCHFQ